VCEVWSAWPCEHVVIATHNLAVIWHGLQRPAGLATLAPRRPSSVLPSPVRDGGDKRAAMTTDDYPLLNERCRLGRVVCSLSSSILTGSSSVIEQLGFGRQLIVLVSHAWARVENLFGNMPAKSPRWLHRHAGSREAAWLR
jgi:hypothetical protein